MTFRKTFFTTSVAVTVFACAWMFLGAQQAHAATKTWDNGGGDGSWNTAANWAPDGVPDTTDDVVFDGTSVANCTIDSTANDTIGSLTIDSGYTGTITVDTQGSLATYLDFTVTGDFVVNSGSAATLHFADDTNYYYDRLNVDNFTVNTGADFTVTYETGTRYRQLVVAGDMLVDTGVTADMALGVNVWLQGNYTQNSGTVTFGTTSASLLDVIAETSDSSDQGNQIVINGGSFVMEGGYLNLDATDFIWNGGTVDFTHEDAWFFDESDDVTDTITIDLVSEFEVTNMGFWGNGITTFTENSVLLCTIDCMMDNNDGAINGPSSAYIKMSDTLGYGIRLPINGSGGTLLIKLIGTTATTTYERSPIKNPVEIAKTGGGTVTLRAVGTDKTFTITSGDVTQSTSTYADFEIQDGGSFVMNGGTFTGATSTRTFSVASGGTLQLNAGTFTAPAATTLLVSSGGTMNVAGGTFDGLTGTTDIDGTFSLSSGTATLTSGNTNISGSLTTSGGTLNHGSGTVVFDGTGASVDLDTSETFNNVTFNLTGNTDAVTIASGDTVTVAGTTTFTNGKINGATVAPQGGVLYNGAHDGGTATISYAATGDQTVTLNASYSSATSPHSINKSSGTISISGDKTWYWGASTFAAGTIDLAGSDIDIYGGDFTHSGGSFADTVGGSASWIDVNEGDWIVNGGTLALASDSGIDVYGGGTFYMNSGTYTVCNSCSKGDAWFWLSGDFNQSGGTFTIGSNSDEIEGSMTVSGGTFDPNGGTMLLDTTSTCTLTGDITFYNLTVNDAGKPLVFNAGDTITVTNTLTLTGSSGSLITMRSSSPGTYWYLISTGTHSVSYVDVQDSNASGGDAIQQSGSTDSGHNLNWIFPEGSSAGRDLPPEILYVGMTMTPYQPSISLTPGSEQTIYWQSQGNVNYVDLYYTEVTDPAVVYEHLTEIPRDAALIADDVLNVGQYKWTIPSDLGEEVQLIVALTDTASVVDILASDVINRAGISDESPVVDVPGGGSDNETIVDVIEDILRLGLRAYFRISPEDTVYYRYNEDYRRPFPNSQILFTWVDSYDVVDYVTREVVSQLTLEAPMLPKPGVTLVQVESQPFIYATFEDPDDDTKLLLRRIVNDETATAIFGEDWSNYILVVPPTLWSHFTIGPNLDLDTIVDPSLLKAPYQE